MAGRLKLAGSGIMGHWRLVPLDVESSLGRCVANAGDDVSHGWKKRSSTSGFTIIELLVVMSLIVILATIGMSQYRTSIVRSKEAVLKEDLFRMNEAIDQYYADKAQYPGTLDALVTEGYMRKVPVDPFSNAADSWQTVPSESDPNNPTAPPGIYAVKSGSDQTALDGTKYSDW